MKKQTGRLDRTSGALTMLVVAALAAWLIAATPADAQPPDKPKTTPASESAFVGGLAALERIEGLLPEVAAANGMSMAQLRLELLNDPTLVVDRDMNLAYFDLLAPGEDQNAPIAAMGVPPVDGPEFQLSSLPGADKTIYLDFDGHVTTGTTWNAGYAIETIESPPYDTDGKPDSWSAAELDVVRYTFATVAEDFAPFNVNVTTIDPGPEALSRSGDGDTTWGARVVFSDDVVGCGCSGHAYVGAFDDTADEPAFVYYSTAKFVAEAASHEVGHMLGLAHDGDTTSSYSRGNDGADSPGWAPIMGFAVHEPVGQWSQQEFFGANNNDPTGANYGNGPDDLAIISGFGNGNDFGYRIDDHGNGPGSATALASGVPVAGIIETRDDVDAFSFTSNGGNVLIDAQPDPTRPNLDIELTLVNGAGTTIATANGLEELDASIADTLAAGPYTLLIDGVGAGAPTADPPTGYTDYGSVGQYTITITYDDAPPPPTPTPTPEPTPTPTPPAPTPTPEPPAPTPTPTPGPEGPPGDVNCSDHVSLGDARAIAMYSVGSRDAASGCPLADPDTQLDTTGADLNGDGSVGLLDARLVAQCAIGIENGAC